MNTYETQKILSQAISHRNLPLTMAIMHLLIVKASNVQYAIPANFVKELEQVPILLKEILISQI